MRDDSLEILDTDDDVKLLFDREFSKLQAINCDGSM